MAAPSTTSTEAIRERSPSASLLTSRTLWGGVAIVSMWLAVLFTGIFGEDLVSTSSSGMTSVPIVAAVALFALLGTVAVARHAFGVQRGDGGLRTEIESQRHALERLAAEVAELRARPPG